MKECNNCGNALKDEAVSCPKCGCTESTPVIYMESKMKSVPKTAIILACCLLLLGIFLAAVMHRSDIKLDDLSGKPNRITALLKFGVPDNELLDKQWLYEDCITLHGIELDSFLIDFEDDSYTIFEWNDDDREELADLLVDKCRLKKSNTAYYDFSYDGAEITAQSDCGYISIEP